MQLGAKRITFGQHIGKTFSLILVLKLKCIFNLQFALLMNSGEREGAKRQSEELEKQARRRKDVARRDSVALFPVDKTAFMVVSNRKMLRRNGLKEESEGKREPVRSAP